MGGCIYENDDFGDVDIISDKIHIQWPARFILKDEEIAPGETVKKSDYWVFENDMSASEVDQIKLLYREHKVEE